MRRQKLNAQTPQDRQCSTACQCRRCAGYVGYRAQNQCDKSRSSRRRDQVPACCGVKDRSAGVYLARKESLTRRIPSREYTFSRADILETFWVELSKSSRCCLSCAGGRSNRTCSFLPSAC